MLESIVNSVRKIFKAKTGEDLKVCYMDISDEPMANVLKAATDEDFLLGRIDLAFDKYHDLSELLELESYEGDEYEN